MALRLSFNLSGIDPNAPTTTGILLLLLLLIFMKSTPPDPPSLIDLSFLGNLK